MIGQRFDQYRVLDRLGDGGMGTVYLAVDETLDRQVALKLLRPELAHRADVVERFRAEAITLARLAHPNIATLYGLSRRGQDFFMVMEYVRGETLEQVLLRMGRLPWDQVVRLGRQVLGALAYAHGMHVVHRDIKPSNLMVDGEGRVKVMDFGLARVLGSDRATRMGHIVGTLEDMSPEQIRGHEVDGRTDQYSLAIVLYELLTGAIPFQATSDFALMTSHLEDEVAPLGTVLPDAPDWLDRAIRKALTKLPEGRFESAQAFRTALAARSGDEDAAHVRGEPRSLFVTEATEPVPLGIAAAAARFTPPPRRRSDSTSPSMPIPKPTRLAHAEGAVSGADVVQVIGRAIRGYRVQDTRVWAGVVVLAVMLAASVLWITRGATSPDDTTMAAQAPPARSPEPTVQTAAPAWAESPQPISPERPEFVEREALPPPVLKRTTEPLALPPGLREPAADGTPGASDGLIAALPPVLPSREPDIARSGELRETAAPVPAPRTFQRINLVAWNSEEEENEEVRVHLSLQAERLEVRHADSSRVMRTVPYANVNGVTYSTRNPQGAGNVGAKIGRAFRALGGPRHWLTVETGADTVVLRLDGREVSSLLAAFEERSGMKIRRPKE